jgi:predicted kinase
MAVTLYALCGLPFAGKSTLAAALASATGAAVVRLDTVNHERGLGLDGSAIPPDEWRRTYDETYRRIALHLANGQSVIFDHGNFTYAERDQLRAIGADEGANVQFMYVQIAEDEARRRLQKNRQTRERYDIRDDDFELVLRIFESPIHEDRVQVIQDLEAELARLR